jgi:pyruvate ferredoxin oxidoreductase alpha subunit
MDKTESFSACGGPVFAETRSACYGLQKRPHIINYIYGLGGRDVRVESIEKVFSDLAKIVETGDAGESYRYLELKE